MQTNAQQSTLSASDFLLFPIETEEETIKRLVSEKAYELSLNLETFVISPTGIKVEAKGYAVPLGAFADFETALDAFPVNAGRPLVLYYSKLESGDDIYLVELFLEHSEALIAADKYGSDVVFDLRA